MKITRRRAAWGIVLAIIVAAILFFPAIWTVKLAKGTARLVTASVSIRVFMDGNEIPGSYGFIARRGFNHVILKKPELIVWIPRPQPGYSWSHGRMILTVDRGNDNYSWVGTPLNDIEFQQRLLFHRYLLQWESSGIAIPCGDIFKSVYDYCNPQFEPDRIRFTLKPNKDIAPFPSHEMEIRVPPEVLVQMAP